MPTQTDLRAAIGELADEARLASLDELAFPAQPAPGRRRLLLAVAGAVTAVLVAALLIAIFAERGRAPSAAGPCGDPGALTPRQCAAALRIAHKQLTQDGVVRDGWPSDVRVVAVVLRRGTVTQPNIGPACISGKLLTIDLIGFFPGENVLGPPPGDDGKVRAIIIQVDAATRRPCLVGLSTSHLTVPAGATVLFRRH